MSKSGSVTPLSPRKSGDFRCYLCRSYFTSREGSWVKWETMEVHLCVGCERDSREVTQRSYK